MNRLHRWYCQSGHWKRTLDSEILPWSVDGVDLRGEILELGPGPGLTTEWLRRRCDHMTCLEVDPNLARSLRSQMANTNVSVMVGDAAAIPFSDGTFSAVVSLTMLHHVASPILQNRVFAEAYRVLRPGGIFVGADSGESLRMRLFHLFDTMVIVDPERLPSRLEACGFIEVSVKRSGGRFRFFARHR